MRLSATPSPERCCTGDGGGRLSAGVSSLPRSVVGCGGVLWDCGLLGGAVFPLRGVRWGWGVGHRRKEKFGDETLHKDIT